MAFTDLHEGVLSEFVSAAGDFGEWGALTDSFGGFHFVRRQTGSDTRDRKDYFREYNQTRRKPALEPEVRKERKRTAAKLTYEQADEIRALNASGTPQKELARQYGVSTSSVSDIVNNRSYRRVQ